MIVAAALLPHSPALIPEIGKDKRDALKKTIPMYKEMVELFESKKISTVIIVSGQTVPFIDAFSINTAEYLKGDFSLFDYDYQFEVMNNLSLSKKIIEQGLKHNIKIHGIEYVLDFGQSIPLYFLQKHLPNINAVALHISLDSPQNHKKLGELIAILTHNISQNIGVIISTDLSNKVDKKLSKAYDKDARKWNLEFMDIVSSDISHLKKIDPFITEDVRGAYPMRAASILEGIFSKYLYKPYRSEYEEVFGVGYGSVLYDML